MADIRTRGAPVSDPWLMVQQELRQMAKLAEQEENEISIAASQVSAGPVPSSPLCFRDRGVSI